MAETAPRDERTEEATAHRLAEARRQGNIPFSREPGQALILIAGILWLAAMLPASATRFMAAASELMARAGAAEADDPGAAIAPLIDLSLAGFAVVGPLMALVIAAPLLAGSVQRQGALSIDKLAPDFSRLNPLAGLQRILGAQNLVEFTKNLTKLLFAGFVVALLLAHEVHEVITTGNAALADGLGLAKSLTLRCLGAVAAIASLVAIADTLWQYFSWRRGLKMTRQEMKDELKSTEGSPELKARIRQMQQARARRRMLLDVPKAAVVIANPTHVAVALAYHGTAEPVPRVVAKGADGLAARIREVAQAAGVPIITNPPLARVLHGSVEVGQTIRPEHYRAVADIISWVLARRDRGEIARNASTS